MPAVSPRPERDLFDEGGGVFVHPQATHEIVLGGHRVAYRLRRAARRSIGLTVGADGLAVAAPRRLGQADLDAALRAKAPWLLRKLAEQRERTARVEAARIDWGDGARLPFLGRMLRVTIDEHATGVVLDAAAPGDAAEPTPLPTLRVGLPPGATAAQLRDAVQGWLQRQARHVFDERCAHYAPLLNVRPRRVCLSSARTRWGSAGADGSVRLNWRLIHFALPVIDYVVVHELAHLRHMDHGPRFWAVVRGAVADVDGARGALRQAVLPAFE